MRQEIVHDINERNKASYSAVAREFYETRKTPWDEFHHFLSYVEEGAKVLDLGCGNGRFYEFLLPKKVDYLGVDNNPHQLEIGREMYPQAHFDLADMMEYDAPAASFDNVFSIAAFHHLPGVQTRRHVVNQLHKILKPNGVLILTVWNLFQWKYLSDLLKGALSFVFHLGLKTAWNDVMIKWGNYPKKRYYHAFLPKELLRFFKPKEWKVEEFYFTKRGNRVSFWRAHNMVLILRRIT